MGGLRILITNNSLGERRGSELYVRDLALGLLQRGHTPIAYSLHLGEVAEEIRTASIPVVDNLHALASPPDLIHGQHNLETMMALLHFPGVPAVNFCHGWLPRPEAPARFPRIYQYVAVADHCRDRLVLEHAIPEDRVRVMSNFVDLQRFQPRAPLPARPERGLIFNSYAREETHLPAVREACARRGIRLDTLGLSAGTACARPELVLGHYDLIFATGRSALEALATGAAVVLCHVVGAGPLVTAAELDRLRALNFGLRALQDPVQPEVLGREIDRYDAQDAAEVCRRIRATAGRDRALDEIEGLYREVLVEHACRGGSDFQAEERAAADYLAWLAPFLKSCYGLEDRARRAERDRERLRSEFEECAARAHQAESERDRLRAEHSQLNGGALKAS